MRLSSTFMPAALILPALCACAQQGPSTGSGDRDQAFQEFVTAQDAARDQLNLFQREPHPSCGSEHLARASAGAETNLALLAPSPPNDPSGPIDAGVVSSTESLYGTRPAASVANLTLEIASSAANAGCPEQARVLYRYVVDRYVRSDYAGYRQRAEVGLAELGEP